MMKKGYLIIFIILSVILLFFINDLFFKYNGDEAPVIYGVRNISINKGEKFDPLKKVRANDREDGNLTDNIIVSGHYNINKSGSYNILYSVSDSAGNTTTVTIKLTVGKTNSNGFFIFFIFLFAIGAYLIINNKKIISKKKVRKYRFHR